MEEASPGTTCKESKPRPCTKAHRQGRGRQEDQTDMGGKDNNTGKKGGCQDQNHDMLPLTSLPTSGQCKVWQPNALTSIIPGHALSLRCAFGMMKTRFRSIFLKALEVHHTFVLQVTHQDSLFIHLFIYLSIEAEKIKIMSIYCFSFPAITACAILHNICLWGGQVGGCQWCSMAGPAVCGGVCPGGG